MTKQPPTPVGGETSQTMDRGLAVLDLLAGADAVGGLTVTEIASRLGVGRPVIYRVVGSLAARDLVRRAEESRIVLGMGLTRLAAAVLPVLRETALPLLRVLADEVGATAHLTVAEFDEALAVAVVEPRFVDLHVSYRVGTRHPLSAGAAGRAILLGREQRQSDLEYVSSTGELQANAHGLAAPVRDQRGVGQDVSVGVVSLSEFTDGDVGPKVAECARELSLRLH